MSTGGKVALSIIIPLLVIGALYVIFFGFKSPKAGARSRINEIDQTLHTSKLTADEVITLNLEKQMLQKQL